ncbi:MAG: serine hydrolase [Halioglobus sp.]|nr:serine hydrolase [Halioglobus sp.]
MVRKLSAALLALASIALSGCSDGSDGSQAGAALPVPSDFSDADASLEAFVAAHPGFSGAAYIVVDRSRGVIHQRAVGDYTVDTVVMLASTSKVPSSMLLMALAEDDDNVDFEIDRAIDDYLPWMGVWPGRTAEQLVSNTSGIPGLGQLAGYGAHLCQFSPAGQLRDCGQVIYETPLDALSSFPPGTGFDYGGSPWQLAGAVAEVVGGASWNQLFDAYIGQPCELEVFRYGNNLAVFADWSGDPDSLQGLDNPNIEGGAISNLADYARLISLHLNEGRCGDTQVLSPEAVAFMRRDRAWATGTVARDAWGYGMGWWIEPPEDVDAAPTLFRDPGAFGALSWIDIERGFGGFMAIQSKALEDGSDASGYGSRELIPLLQAAYDAVRP